MTINQSTDNLIKLMQPQSADDDDSKFDEIPAVYAENNYSRRTDAQVTNRSFAIIINISKVYKLCDK